MAKNKIKTIVLLVLILGFITVSPAQVKIIFDTDIGGDADDLGALAMLHGFVKNGECELLAVMIWNTEKYAVPMVDAVNRFYGNSNIPIGVRSGGTHTLDFNHGKIISENLPHKLNYEDVPETTDLYRKVLADQPDSSIVIVCVGPLKNIKRVLESTPCEHSGLNGKELLHKKVKKMVIMGGQYPEGEWEWNFCGGMPGVTKFVLENLGMPVIFSGYELGLQIQTGYAFNNIDQNHPLYLGFKHFSKHAPWMKENFQGRILNNATYDQTAVLYAVRGGVGLWWDKIKGGYNKADENGGNRWIEATVTNHSYLRLLEDSSKLGSLIEDLMLFDICNNQSGINQ
ncbi:nucleoside hydrolase [Natronoflexus pectinivorans]|uniref:Inosine-uridine nucleoside N-ribohydrolase n=1 Tax=Natronoflexus pectinivorans TaxID=682526 RepID=A0A4R2GMU4_9BACT|nr:nucleoside hydrolase [Natronoflexus pectinivorans]TCO10553.1 inosine-uridine nucleoside N-ribohydrolase [Natronoflexus pectinivorans]